MEGLNGVIFVQSIHYFPFILINLSAALQNIDRSMEESAQNIKVTVDAQDDAGNTIQFQGTVSGKEFLGSTIRYRVTVRGDDVFADVSHQQGRRLL
jgi:hypothetical protein